MPYVRQTNSFVRVSTMKTSLSAGLFAALILFAVPAQAQFGLFKSALVKGDEAYEREDFEAALKHYTKAAKKDDAEAQFKLGRLYDRGEGTEADPAEALIWYTRGGAGLDMAQTNSASSTTPVAARKRTTWLLHAGSEAARQGNPLPSITSPSCCIRATAFRRTGTGRGALRPCREGCLAFLPHAELLGELGHRSGMHPTSGQKMRLGRSGHRQGVLLQRARRCSGSCCGAGQYQKAAEADCWPTAVG